MTTPLHRPTLSVVAPVFNEEAILPELYRRLSAVLDGARLDWELVLINDGSRDRSPEIMRELHAADPRVKVINFARNFGLQDPPEVILDLLAKWREGYEVVYAVRSERKGETFFKEFTAKAFYRIIYKITDINIPMDTGDFRLMDHKVVEALRTMREKHRFMRGMSVWVGFKQTGVHYVRAERFAGSTKYPLKKMLKFALDGITSFSYFPLQLATYIGSISAALAVVGIVATIILRLTGSQAFYGQATTLVAVLFLGGVQLVSLGIIGEYLGRIYDEVKGRPLYIVRETLGFEEKAAERVAVR
jgi:dolichol-phosphate mannosyltransferase